MKAYKGFTEDLEARLGNGIFKYEIGNTYEEKECKTARNGFHCCENPFSCLSYYTLGRDRFCEVEAEIIDEDNNERIACKRITIIRELSLADFAKAGYEYIASHPKREGWEKTGYPHLDVCEDARGYGEGDIAISRAKNPRVKAKKGTIVGLMEDIGGEIKRYRMFKARKDGIFIIKCGELAVEEGVRP